jgi:16S rRNA processing protein RimM
VIDQRTGQEIGVVSEWQEYGGPPLLEVTGTNGRELLIPFAKSICVAIDPVLRRVEVELPEGLDTL